MFLQALRLRNDLCDHSNDSFSVHNRILQCNECDFKLPLEFYFTQRLSEWDSLHYAELYAKWTGDRSIPCTINLGSFERIFSVNRIKTTFETVATVDRLLRIVHEPLKKETPQPTPEDLLFFRETVLSGLRTAIDRVSSDEDFLDRDFIGPIVRAVLKLLLKHTENVPYFDVVVPHLKRIHRRYFYVYPDMKEQKNIFLSFLKRFDEMSKIYLIDLPASCAAFDAVQVAVLCYLCQNDPGLVSDLVLDFAVRFCRGYQDDAFSNPRSYHGLSDVQSTFDGYVSLESHPKVHLYLERLREGNLEDCFSDEFFRTHWRLKSALEDSVAVTEFDYLYPRAFFRNYIEYYAFWAALSHYAAEIDVANKNINEVLVAGLIETPRGVITRCKEIYRFVKKALAYVKRIHECIVETQIQKYDKSLVCDDQVWFEEHCKIKTNYTGTRQMVKKFFDPEFAKEIAEKIEWIANLPLTSKNDPDLKPECLVKLYKIYSNKGEKNNNN